MRTALATVAMSWLALLGEQALAQQWTVDLYDVTIEDPAGDIDRTRAESVEFLPDGKLLATAGFDYNAATRRSVGEVRLYNATDGSVSATLRGTAGMYANRAGCLAVSSSGKRIAAAGRCGSDGWVVDIFDATTGKLARTTLRGELSPITCVVFSPDEKLLAVARMNAMVELWSDEDGRLISSFAAHPDGVWPIAFSPDGHLLATGNGDGSVSFRDLRSGRQIGSIPAQPELGFLGSVVFSSDGKFMATGGYPKRDGDSPIFVWELIDADKHNAELATRSKSKFEGHREHTYALAFSPDAKLLASANRDTTVRLWDVSGNNHLRPITAHRDFVYDAAFSPDGTSLATLSRDCLKLWTVTDLRKPE